VVLEAKSERLRALTRALAYRKLGICSQNELFSRYFQLMTQQQAHGPAIKSGP
jgi:hypothetical protein